jgi:hypothetical protein
MGQKDEIGLLVVVFLFCVFLVLWLSLRSNTLIGRLMRSWVRSMRRRERNKLDGK